MSSGNLLEAFRKNSSNDSIGVLHSSSLSALSSEIQSSFEFLCLIENVAPEKPDLDSFCLNYVSNLFESRRMSLSNLFDFMYAPRFYRTLRNILESEIRSKRLSFLLSQCCFNQMRNVKTHELPDFFQKQENRLVANYVQRMRSHGGVIQVEELFQNQRNLFLRKVFAQHTFFIFIYAAIAFVLFTVLFLVLKGDSLHLVESVLAWIEFLKNFFSSISQ